MWMRVLVDVTSFTKMMQKISCGSCPLKAILEALV